MLTPDLRLLFGFNPSLLRKLEQNLILPGPPVYSIFPPWPSHQVILKLLTASLSQDQQRVLPSSQVDPQLWKETKSKIREWI